MREMKSVDVYDYQYGADAITVGELKKILSKLPKDAKVYMVFDKTSDDAWDDESSRWRYGCPVAYAEIETIYDDSGFDQDARNLILEIENP